MAVRNDKGQFEKGFSGNEYGRAAKKQTSHRLPATNRNSILAIAERRIEITVGGKKEEMSLFEANVLRLGMDGANGNRLSARQFAQLLLTTAKEDLTMTLSSKVLMAEMDETQSEIERLRSKLERRTGVVILPPTPRVVPPEARLDDGRMSLD